MLFISVSFLVAQQPTQPHNLSQVEWLLGTWNRTNAKPGRTGIEEWKKVSDTELHGRGISMKGTDTTFIEKIKIVKKEDTLYYVADVAHNKNEIVFKFISLTNNSFVCENPNHDFPKKISYQFDGNVLKASISGDGKSIEYLFERKK